MVKIKLPDLKRFISYKKGVSPWEKFYDWLTPRLPHNKKLGNLLYGDKVWGIPSGYGLDVTKIGLCEEDYKRISKYTYNWAKRIEMKLYKDKYVQASVGMLELECAPKEYRAGRLRGINPGYVYIEDNYLRKNV